MRDLLGLRAFLDTSVHHAPGGLPVTPEDTPAVTDPRLVTVSLPAP